MKKTYIILIIIGLCLIGCLFFIPRKPKVDVYMHTEIEQVFSQEQFDSLCISDNISNNLEDWDMSLFFEDSTILMQYLYVVNKNDTSIVYSAIPADSTIIINKRISIGQ